MNTTSIDYLLCGILTSNAADSLELNEGEQKNCNTEIMAGPPRPPVPHVAPIYRLTATALGAGMWFWVSVDGRSVGEL